MTMEKNIADNTAALVDLAAAVRESTEARLAIAGEAAKLAGGKVEAPAADKPKAKPETAAAKKKRLAAEKKAEEDAAAAEAEAEKKQKAEKKTGGKKKSGGKKKKDGVEPREDLDPPALFEIAALYLSDEDLDEETVDERRAECKAALTHLGYDTLAELEDDEDMQKFAFYLDNWLAENDHDLETMDEMLESALGEDSGKKDVGI